MKWTPTVFVLLVPSALSAEEAVRSHNRDQLRRHDDADTSSSATAILDGSSNTVGRQLAHGEKRKQRKKERKKASNNQSSIMAEEATTSTSSTMTTTPGEATTSTEPTTTATDGTTPTTQNVDNFDSSTSKMQLVRSSYKSSSTITQNLHVSHVYTYGAPSAVKGPPMSNPNNSCIPGIRIYTEDVEVVNTCPWWKFWCGATGRVVTNVDFAAQINVKEGYPHPKMATLVIRSVDDSSKVEYTYRPCRDYENVKQYNHQWWPNANEESNMLWDRNHDLDEHYERRLLNVPNYIRGPSLEYVSVARCSNKQSYNAIRTCLNQYDQETSSKIGGVSVLGWQPFAYMVHETERSIGFLSDTDTLYVLRNDQQNSNHRKCIIAFQGSDGTTDLANFAMGSNDDTGYCGRYGVHTGVSDELWKITHDPQYANIIKPALETCDDVTCVGHSLGGALCNVFTMCANQGLGYLDGSNDAQMWDDYNSLIWTKKGS
ncbi:hypothetical protein ACHAXR_010452 [Thalassiosira sp. AJA248-18]